MSSQPTISLLTDYGNRDEFAGVVRATLRRLAPAADVIDLTHEIPPGDIRAGALALARAAPWLASGVVVGVVDPTVGTDRRAVAVDTSAGLAFVGPDNGLLVPAIERVGGGERAVVLDLAPSAPPRGGEIDGGRTFDGRDLFAPAAAHLANRGALEELGPHIDPAWLVRLDISDARRGSEEAARVDVVVWWIDRFGNAELNASPDIIAGWGDRIDVGGGCTVTTVRRVGTFADLDHGEIGLLVDSQGRLALAANRAAAAERLGLVEGDALWIGRSTGEAGC